MHKNYIENQLALFSRKIKTANHIAIVTHKNPDGDAIGSALAMSHFLQQLGKKNTVFVSNQLPAFLEWMPGANRIVIFDNDSQTATRQFEQTDLLICTDFNTPERAGNFEQLIVQYPHTKVLIDHHPMPDERFDIAFSDTAISSASELVYTIIKHLNPAAVEVNAATCVYTGMMTDTGNFSHNCSQPTFFRNIADLLELNIHRDYIYSRVFNTFSESRLRLLGYSLHEKLQLLPDFYSSIISLSIHDLTTYHYQFGDTEGFVNIPFSLKNVIFSVLLLEKDDHIKMSLRSRGKFDVNQLARKYFNGGGHSNAAGGKLHTSLAEAIVILKEIVEQHKAELHECYQDLNR